MWLIDSLAEERIQAALRAGEFDGLPGQGRPLELDDDSQVPAELRVAYRVLKNAGCVPPELELRNEVDTLEALLDTIDDDAEQRRIQRRLCLLATRLASRGHDVGPIVREGAYREKILLKLAGDAGGPACLRGIGERDEAHPSR